MIGLLMHVRLKLDKIWLLTVGLTDPCDATDSRITRGLKKRENLLPVEGDDVIRRAVLLHLSEVITVTTRSH